MRIGIYGGSFNPIHNGHITMAREAWRQMKLDEVWLMVSPHNPLKQSATLLDDHLRLELAQLATENEEGLRASDFEFSLNRPSFTWNTLQALGKHFPQHEFSLLVGADNWAVFHKWFAYDKILQHHDIIIYPRKNCDIDESNLPCNVKLLHTKLVDISSTEIRWRLRYNLPVSHLVPPAAEEKIVQYYSNKQNLAIVDEEVL